MSPIDSFLSHLKQYREPKNNLIGDSYFPSDPSGNALLHESHAAWVVKDYGELSLPHLGFYETLHLLSVDRGLLRRKPAPALDPQTHDDYIGVTSVCSAMGFYTYDHGKTHSWWYDWQDPNATFWTGFWNIVWGVKPISSLDLWHSRMPGVKQHYMISAGVEPSRLGWAIWLASIFWSIRKPGNESGWLLSYLMLRTAGEMFPDSWAYQKAKNEYIYRLNECYKGNISDVYSVYYGPSHPITLHSSWPERPRGYWNEQHSPDAYALTKSEKD